MQSIDNLAWTVAGVGAQGQAYSSFVCFNGSLKSSYVAFLHAVFLELALQIEIRFHAECHYKQPTCRHIKAVNDDRPRGFGVAFADK